LPAAVTRKCRFDRSEARRYDAAFAFVLPGWSGPTRRPPPEPSDVLRWQAFAVLLPVRTVGVMGDGRSYDQVLTLYWIGLIIPEFQPAESSTDTIRGGRNLWTSSRSQTSKELDTARDAT
jgi:hypothetical protein